jgi:hypothetical protein
MPTGNTAAIQDGTDTSVRRYLVRVGRGFGLAMHQRDDDIDAPIVHAQPSSYHAEGMVKAQAIIDVLEENTHEQNLDACGRAFRKRRAEWEHHVALTTEARARYEAMIAKVETWEPPAELAGVKVDALRQLRESLEHDCNSSYAREEPTPVDVMDWWETEIAEARRSLAYHTEKNGKEAALVAEQNAMIDAFYASLPAEDA